MRRHLAVALLGLVLATAGTTILPTGPARADGAGANGRIIFTRGDPTADDFPKGNQIWSMNPDGSGLARQFSGHDEDNFSPVWSPDGKRIAFHRAGKLVVADADGSNANQLGTLGSGSWSPDGTRLVYVSFYRGLQRGVGIMNADGTDAHEIRRADLAGEPSWSPDGSRIVFQERSNQATGGGGIDLKVMDVDGNDVRDLVPDLATPLAYMELQPRWSPDGARIVFVSNRDRPDVVCPQCFAHDLYTIGADGTGLSRIPREGSETSVAWSPDGGSLAYVETPDPTVDRASIDVLDLSSGQVRHVFGQGPSSVDWAPAPGSFPRADLVADLSASTTAVLPGTPVTYTATIRNVGGGPATNAAVEVRPPAGSAYDPNASPGCLAASGGALRCGVGGLPAGGEAAFSVRTVTSGAGVGEASALAISATVDSNTTNNRATMAVAVCTRLGSAKADRLRGSHRADVLCGGGGDDRLLGRGGNDVLIGGAGRDRVDGGGGKDTVSYAQAGARVAIDLARGTADGDGADLLRRVENAVGSRYADRLVGSPRDNVLKGGGGDDDLAPGGGRDHVDGGLGQDRIDYRGAGHAVDVNLLTRRARGFGSAVLASIEGAWGSRFADRLVGSVTGNVLSGGAGSDVVAAEGGNDDVRGGAGPDRLSGGDGDDYMSGGAGLDSCRQDFGRGRATQCERR
jgi:uncharacterized repeat protein (TIGR01451 family)